MWGIIIGVCAGAGAIGALMKAQMREPRVEVTPDTFVVRSLFYGDVFSMADVTSVSLEANLPTIRARTNGFALGSTLRGNFAMDELGRGKLFIERDRPPFVVVRMKRGYVIVNNADAADTRAIYEAFQKHRSAT